MRVRSSVELSFAPPKPAPVDLSSHLTRQVILMCYVYTLIVDIILHKHHSVTLGRGFKVWMPRDVEIEGTLETPPTPGAPAASRAVFVEVGDNSSAQHEAIAWLGFLFVLVTSNVIVWPLSWCIAKLPPFNRVL